MGIIYNPLERDVTVKAFGNYFTFKPKQLKLMEDKMARWLAEYRRDEGLVLVGHEFEDLEYRKTPEGLKALKVAEDQGLKNRVRKLRMLKDNIASLQKDLDMKNLKIDARTMASSGEIAALEELASLQAKQKDEGQVKIDRIKELEKLLED